jgi:serine/threonine-protein kinase
VLKAKYRLDRLLGVGGMAAVYAATHTRNASRVAVKVLHSELSVNADIRARFVREGYAANIVEHPGVVRVLDDDVDADGSVFLVMELLDGETLEARWERSGHVLPTSEVVSLVIDLLEVLAAAHVQGVVHRDLKAENLFLCRDGTLKILDFGVARVRESSPTKTKTGAVFGTPAFMPPEQALGRVREVDALSDVWAVGAMAFTLLTGRLVHEADTVEQVLIFAATKPAPKLATVLPLLPTPIAEVVDRALAFEKGARWPSAKAMRDAMVSARDAVVREQTGDDLFDASDLTRLAPPPAMTVPPGQGASAGEGSETTVPTTTVGGVTSRSEAQRVRIGVTLAAFGAGGLLVMFVLVSLALSTKARHPTPAIATASVAIPTPTAAPAASSAIAPQADLVPAPAASVPAASTATAAAATPTPAPRPVPTSPRRPAPAKRDPLAP